MEDDFGDDSFLDDFDVDAAVASRENTRPSVSNAVPPAPKRLKAHNNDHHSAAATTTADEESLKSCLSKYFGFSQFRPGQIEAIQACLQGKDVAVFWSTGAGKSLVYTLPALYTQKTCLVVSPLISLMQDQVHKLNHLGFGSSLATYLGSAQTDGTMEARVLQGEFRLVYCTPEKLQSGDFLDTLANRVPLCLIAIDEAHCVSDWGFDFRPDYRQAGIRIRSHPKLSQVPLMALTATAMPRIQQDILETLHMHQNVVKCLQSFDRTNLAIQVRSRDGGVRSAMEPLVQELLNRKPGSASSLPSTIVYCPTKAQVEEVAAFLQQRLQGSNTTTSTTTATPLVEYYHAGLSTERRKETHLRFLTGQTTVVVATIAFGMGIDKPDTRKVIHYGPPKTVEEYYQQIGRAGRDGLPSECILYCSMADFDRYKSDFYLQGLNPKARAATEQSTAALKGFAMSRDKCRRKSLLEFFQERPAFGDFCGTCDVCQTRKEFGEDTLRDFGPAVRFILSGIIVLKEQGMTTLLQVLSGQVLESYRYTLEAQQQATGLAKGFLAQRKALEKRLTNEQIKEFVPSLIQKEHIHETTIQKKIAGYSRSWTVFGLSESGKSLLMDPSRKDEPVHLTVPQSIREAEYQAKLRRQRVLEQLEAAGVELAKLPPKEIEDGDGEVIQAYLKWNRRLEGLEKSGNTERLTQVQELLQVIQSWRSKTATELQMAPSNVLAEHLLFGIAYTAQSLHGGMKMSPSDLQQVGARNQKIATLAQDINDWLGKYRMTHLGTSGDDGEAMVLQFPPGKIQGTKWPYAVYRPNKKTGLASWESSYNRFAKDESPTSIAMAPSSGKPLAVTTVIGHVVEAAVQGKPVDLSRLASFAVGGTLPTKNRWAQLEEAEAELQMSVAGNPEMSGKDGGKYYMTDLLQPIMGKDFADKPRESRTEEEKAKFSSWCETLKWYTLVKRTGMSPQFAKQS